MTKLHAHHYLNTGNTRLIKRRLKAGRFGHTKAGQNIERVEQIWACKVCGHETTCPAWLDDNVDKSYRIPKVAVEDNGHRRERMV